MFTGPPTTGLPTVRLGRSSIVGTSATLRAAGAIGTGEPVGHARAARRGLQAVALVLVLLFGGLGITGGEAPLLESTAPLAAAALLAVAVTVRRAAQASSRRRWSRHARSPVMVSLVPASAAAATFDDPPRGPPALRA